MTMKMPPFESNEVKKAKWRGWGKQDTAHRKPNYREHRAESGTEEKKRLLRHWNIVIFFLLLWWWDTDSDLMVTVEDDDKFQPATTTSSSFSLSDPFFTWYSHTTSIQLLTNTTITVIWHALIQMAPHQQSWSSGDVDLSHKNWSDQVSLSLSPD